jgi:small GTP-binding protein
MAEATYIMKIVVLGDGEVGKTSLRTRFMGRSFDSQHFMTIGADFASIDRQVGSSKIKFQVWDLAGQAAFQGVRKRFYQGTYGGLIIFDLTSVESFTNMGKWIQELWQYNGSGPIPIILLGNKSDLKQSVKDKDVKKYAEQLSEKTKPHGFSVSYIKTSALTGENVDKAFYRLGLEVVRKRS